MESTRKSSTVAVFSGGPTDEHPISIETGKAASRAIQALGHTPLNVVIDRDLRWRVNGSEPLPLADGLKATLEYNPGAAFLGLHGPFGEDGTIQAILDAAGLGYQGSGVRASALAMNKSMTKAILGHAGFPVAPEWLVTRENRDSIRPEAVFAKLGEEVFVKPVHLGSSVGAAQAESLRAVVSDPDGTGGR